MAGRLQNFGFTIFVIVAQRFLLAVGENPKIVSEGLGHASIVLTLDTYSHVLPSMQQAATEKLETMPFQRTGTR